MYDLCKGKKICEGGDEMDLNPDNPDNQTNPVSFFSSGSGSKEPKTPPAPTGSGSPALNYSSVEIHIKIDKNLIIIILFEGIVFC